MGLFNKDEKKPICPLLNGPCIEARCMFWTRLVGKDPQSDQDIDKWSCAVAWLPILLVENAQMTRQGTSTVQHFRNEVHGAATALAEESIRRRELEERRLEMDNRLLELTKAPKLLTAKKTKKAKDE